MDLMEALTPTGLGAPNTPASNGFSWGGVLLGVGVFAAGIAGLYLYFRRPGWYVLQYTDPVGDPNRRLKGYAGPYPTRGEAVTKARTMLGVWVPKVEHLDVPPF